jgi:hypothetical protein
MSELSNIPPASLILHIVVDFGRKPGIGNGIIQRAATNATRTSSLPAEEHGHGIERSQVGSKNVKTPERAHMFALILAMGVARSTLKRRCINAQNVAVLCSLPEGATSLENVVSKEDRLMIKRVLACVQRLSRYGVRVSVVNEGEEGSAEEAARVKMIAHHRKKRACRRRRHGRRILSANVGMAYDEEEDGESDGDGDGERVEEESGVNNGEGQSPFVMEGSDEPSDSKE